MWYIICYNLVMVKKKSTKKNTNCDYKALSIALGIATVGLAVAVGWLTSTRISYQESQELQAFEGLASAYIYNSFAIDGEQTATIDDIGVTDDKDLYVDFIITKYEDHVPQANRKSRLHFQCDQKTDKSSGCAHAYWYGDWEETTEEYRAMYRAYIDKTEALTEAYNAAETDEEREEILAQEQALYDEYKDFFGVENAD